jgi:Icc-related predicted phosphoesterase
MVKLRELLPKLFSKDSTELVKTGAESTKAVFDLAKAIKENKPTLAELQPYLGQISSLLDVLNSPWGQVIKEAVPFASLAMTLLSLGCEQLKPDPSLEECVVLVTQAAYLASWQAEIVQNPDRFSGIDLSKTSVQIDRNFKKLADIEIDRAAATQLITALPASDLVKQFNQILVDRLVESGVNSAVASRFADRVAWNAPRYVNEMVAEHAEKIKVLAEVYRNGGKEVLAHYASIDEYLRDRIEQLPSEQVFDETDLQLREIYVPLEIQPLAPSGGNTSAAPQLIEAWAIDKLLDPHSQAILFIQGEAGRGKSVFCRMFADLVRRELAFTPILIRLREILTLGDTFTETLQQYLENFDFSKDNSWLTNKNQRFLFLLDGFDELILQGRSTGGLKEFIEQVEKFQSTSHHRILITGRPLAMQGIEKSVFRNNCLERVTLLPMNDEIRNTWLGKWAAKFGELEIEEFVNFLKAFPTDKGELAREPLQLYMLGRMHRNGEIIASELSGTSAIASKVNVYDKTIEWVLEKSRKEIFNFELDTHEFRQLLTEVAVCIIQSGNEIAKVSAIEYRLTKDPNNNLKELFDKIFGTAVDKEKALNNLLTTFYIQPAQGDTNGSVKFAHKSFGEFLFAERIKEAFIDWSSTIRTRNKEEDQIRQNDLEWQIYDLLGSGCLTRDTIDYLLEMLSTNTCWQPSRLLGRLKQFWGDWYADEFIDRTEDNLPQKKMKILKEQMPDREIRIGIRMVEFYTGLNILTLLLELHYSDRHLLASIQVDFVKDLENSLPILRNSIKIHPLEKEILDDIYNRYSLNNIVINESIFEKPDMAEIVLEPLRILHLSDLHIKKDSDPQSLLQPLIADIRDLDGGLGFEKLDYLVVSGDITNYATPEEFEKARQFISELIDQFQISSEQCIIIPGNHDLDWNEEVYNWKQKRLVNKNGLKNGSYVDQEKGFLIRDEELYLNRFKNFSEKFYRPIVTKEYSLKPEEQCIPFLFSNTRIQFLAMNSCWEIDEYFPDRSSIYESALTRGLIAAEKQIQQAQKMGELSKEAKILRIAVWHHPVTGNEKMEQDAFLDRLLQSSYKLCLHGHIHENRADIIRYIDPTRRIHVAGAGSFGAPVNARPESTPRLYNLLEIERDHSKIKIHTRRLIKDGGAWEGWATWPGKSSSERLTYYEIPLNET